MLVSTLPGLVLPCQSGQQWTWGRHRSGCCRGSRSAQCCTWVFQCSTLFRQMSTFSTFIQGVTTYLKSSPMPPYSTGLLTPSRPASPSFLNTWTVFAFDGFVWIKSSPTNKCFNCWKVHLCCWVHPLLLPLGDKWVDVLNRVDCIQNFLEFI